ncbi:MAG TPA: family 20 glycosylhydrolase [Puia sp.]|nr:family 20 glycosylhydrolase [Puia sp.]
MKYLFVFLFCVILAPLSTVAQQQNTALDSILPVRGMCINLPRPAGLDSFVLFIDKELASRKINLLVLMVEYGFRFKAHPELTDSFALSLADVKRIVKVCRNNNIRIVPSVNMLGHQSWANRSNRLLRVYPQFDETPYVKMPEKYEWPNADNLYCKSYCPLHPDLHPVIFSVMDEICDAFEADAFHAGMDEVFYLGEDKCERCAGRDKAELFAGEVRAIHDHLATKNRKMFIWGDRLLDGKTTGLGIWEASYNNTYRAIDMIPKDVVICDWHYERADKTAVYFAMKGFSVITCPWRIPQVAVAQVNDMVNFRKQSTGNMTGRFRGVMETTWSRTDVFLRGFYNSQSAPITDENTAWNCFRVMYEAVLKL